MSAPADGQLLLGGKVRVVRPLGAGAIGDVFEVEHTLTRHRRAMKVLKERLREDADTVERFLREASAAGRIGNAHIVETFDAGYLESGAPYLLMELLAGESLGARLQRDRQLPVALACDLIAQACEAISAAHASGIVHRDLKPDNLFLVDGPDGVPFVKVLDFGVSKFTAAIGADDPTLTDAGTTMGTPLYMAPEQMRGARDVDGRADVYSLGVVLYACLAGARPFEGTSFADIAARVLVDAPTPITLWRSDLPEGLADVIARAIARGADARYPTVHAFQSAVVPFITASFVPPRAKPPNVELTPTTPRHALATSPLPAPRGRLVGREAETRALLEALKANRLVSIVGPGGSGKTRVALAAAQRWKGPVLFLDLSEATAVDALQSALASALDVRATDKLGQALESRGGALVVVDGAERLPKDADATLTEWLAAAPRATLLVTSLRRLRLDGEHVVELPPYAEAAQLFVERARAVQPSFRAADDQKAAIEALVDALDRLPLAIELAAARVGMLDPSQLLARLETRFELLRVGEGRNESLRGLLDSTWELLTPAQRSALAQLSVFRGGAGIDAAEAVLALDGANVLDALEALRELSLVKFDGKGRLAIAETIRAYAALHLNDEGLIARHSAWYAQRADALLAASEGPNGARALAEISADRANLELVTERSPRPADVASAVLALNALLVNRGPAHIHLALLERALAATEGQVGPNVRAQLVLALAIAQGVWRLRKEAFVSFARAMPMDMSDRFLGRLRQARGAMMIEADDPDAMAELSLGLELATRAGDTWACGRAKSHLATLLDRAGRADDAIALYEQALALHRQCGDRRFEGITLANLANVLMQLGSLAQAAIAFEQALALHRATGNRRSEGILLINYGLLRLDQGQVPAARAALTEGLAVVREVGDLRFEALGRLFVATLKLLEADWAPADAELRDAALIAHGGGAPSDEAWALSFRAVALCGLKRPGEARQLLAQADQLLEPTADFAITGVAYVCRAAVEEAEAARARLVHVMASRPGELPLSKKSDVVRLAARCVAVFLKTAQ